MTLVQSNHLPAFELDHNAILRTLKLNPSDPATQALLLVCDRYNLDPVLKHMVLISGNPYVTRDGLLHVAHRSGMLDGIEVVDCGEYQTHYWAKVAVYRKDMGRPFTYVGRFAKAKPMAKEFGPEMAVKTAEVAALRRAFSVAGLPAALDSEWAVEPHEQQEHGAAAGDTQPAIPAQSSDPFDQPDPVLPTLSTEEQRKELRARIEALPVNDRALVAKAWKSEEITALGRPERFTEADYMAARTLIELAEERVAIAEAPFEPDPAA